MNVRALVVTLAAVGIPVAFVAMLLPITWGYGGYFYGSLGIRGQVGTTSHTSTLIYVDPDGPAYKAGLCQGETIIAALALLAEHAGIASALLSHAALPPLPANLSL